MSLLARQAGFTQFLRCWIPHLREQIEATLRSVGAQKPFARNAEPIDRADHEGSLAWTLPLDRSQAVALVGIIRTAAIITVAAVSGMRSKRADGTPDRLLPPTRAVRRRHGGATGWPARSSRDSRWAGSPTNGSSSNRSTGPPNSSSTCTTPPNPAEQPLLGRFAFDVRYKWFRNWVNGPVGQRLGLASISEIPVSLRALRRTLEIGLAYRPGGILAAKIHLKHVAVATTEGYASRPGGAQAELLSEVNKHEAERNLDLVWAEFRNYQQGILPAGPAAGELTEFFAHVDAKHSPGRRQRAQRAAW